MIKDLLIDWEIAITEYYNQYKRHELEVIYFHRMPKTRQLKEGLDKDTMMKELIEHEYNYRINDTVEDLKEDIEFYQEYTIL